MTAFNSPIGVDVRCARRMVQRGSRLIWVLGEMDEGRLGMLKKISPDVHNMRVSEIMESKSPEKLVGSSPVLVCEHGITSLFVAQGLRKRGVEAFSVEGGVDGMFKR